MSETKLAIEKHSSVSWVSVLFTNALITLSLTCLGGGAMLAYWAVHNNKGIAIVIIGLAVTIIGSRVFRFNLINGALIRKLRYTGTAEVEASGLKWRVAIPRWAFRSGLYGKALDKAFIEALEKMPKPITTKDTSLTFVVGYNQDLATEPQVMLVHKCQNRSKCNKPEIHLFGYSEKRDGALFWPTI